MDNFLLHYKLCQEKKNLEEKLLQLVSLKANLYNLTQPKSPIYDDVKILDKNIRDKFGDYIDTLESMNVNERIELLNGTIENCKKLIKNKEDDLKNSFNLEDKVYFLKFVQNKNNNEIMKDLCYQRTVVYNIVKKIKDTIRASCEAI